MIFPTRRRAVRPGRNVSLLLAAATATAVAGASPSRAQQTPPAAPVAAAKAAAYAGPTTSLLPLKVVGNQIENSAGVPVILRGVDAASMEFTSDGEGHILDTVRTAVEDWHANLIRLPLSQDRWFGHGPEQTGGDPAAYRALVDKIVSYCAAHNCYILLDLHWNDANIWGQHIGQHKMPDQKSVLFWQDLPPLYANNPAVLFDLYNEPHDISWDIWQHGGLVSERDRRTNYTGTYVAVGLQELLDTVRATGANNVVLAGGLDWSYDMSGFLNGHQLSDPQGNGVVYANHAYPFKGDTVGQWIAKMETATKTLPVIVSEWGAEPSTRGYRPMTPAQVTDWVDQMLAIMQTQHWNWTAWDLHRAAGPTLISDWNYTPTPTFGAMVKAQLIAGPSGPPATPPAAAAPVSSAAPTAGT